MEQDVKETPEVYLPVAPAPVIYVVPIIIVQR